MADEEALERAKKRLEEAKRSEIRDHDFGHHIEISWELDGEEIAYGFFSREKTVVIMTEAAFKEKFEGEDAESLRHRGECVSVDVDKIPNGMG